MRELLETVLKKTESIIREYGVKNGYASEIKSLPIAFKYTPDNGSGHYEGDVTALKILIESFNTLIKIHSQGIDAKCQSAALELISTFESLHVPGRENVRGLFTTTRFSPLQLELASFSKVYRDQYTTKKEELDRIRVAEENKASSSQEAAAKAQKKEEKRKRIEEEKKEERRKHDEEQEKKFRQMMEEMNGKSAGEIAKIEAKYKDALAASEKKLADKEHELEEANETIANLSMRLPKGAHLVPAANGADNSTTNHLGFNDILSAKTPEQREVDELAKRIGIRHAKYVCCLAAFSKLTDEQTLSTKAKESLMQLLVNYEKPIIKGTTEFFKSITLQNSANQEMVKKKLEEMALLEQNDTEDKHKKTIEDFHTTEAANIVGRPSLTPQTQILSKIKDFVMGYDKKPPSQMIGTIPELNLALEERITALKTERKKQIAQQSAAAATGATATSAVKP